MSLVAESHFLCVVYLCVIKIMLRTCRSAPCRLIHTYYVFVLYMTSCSTMLMSRMTAYLRGAGGFSKSSQPFSYSNYPPNQVRAVKIPKDKPFSVFEDCTQSSQVCTYYHSFHHFKMYRISTCSNFSIFLDICN